MKYLVTGISGFLGPHLAKQLIENGHEVCGLIRSNRGSEQDIRDILSDEIFSKIVFLYGDLINYRSINLIMKENNFDGVFHLAAQTHPPTSFTDPIGTWEANVMGSINLITALNDNQPGCRFIFCSTVEVYGNEGIDGRKIKEDNVILPANPYGASKAAIDLYIAERMKNKQMNATVIRPFCFTGPRRGAKFSIASDAVQIARMVLGKQDKTLRIGNLDTIRAVTDVRDIANAFYLAMTNDVAIGKTYNVCGGDPLQMRNYTNMLLEFSGLTDVKMQIDEKLWRPIDIQFQDGDASLVKEELGWEPKYDIKTTIKDLLEFWINKIRD
uniref:NAD(P)-binding domain-containing protein n=1 Tax=viral metagenome TaxID=1070528 RepID=A0A6C0B3F7_9ZZZZ